MREKIATLLAYDSFELENKKLFVIFGDLEMGSNRNIKPGMNIHIGLNSSFSVSENIHSIENLLKDGCEYTAICLRYEDKEEMEMIKALNIGDEICEIYSA